MKQNEKNSFDKQVNATCAIQSVAQDTHTHTHNDPRGQACSRDPSKACRGGGGGQAGRQAGRDQQRCSVWGSSGNLSSVSADPVAAKRTFPSVVHIFKIIFPKGGKKKKKNSKRRSTPPPLLFIYFFLTFCLEY